MKTFQRISSILLALTAFGLHGQSQSNPDKVNPGQTVAYRSVDQGNSSSQFVNGAITLKLRVGVGDYGAQSGMVRFGIQSLDEKTAKYEVSQLEKRFRFNPANMREGLPDLSRIYKVTFSSKYSPDEVVRAFSSDPNVEYAELIPVYRIAEVPDDPLYSQQQHLPQIFAEEAWAIHKGEAGSEEIVIAIVDSGVDWDHEDLNSNIWQNLLEDADGDGHTKEFNGTQWILDPGDLNGIDDDSNGFTDDLLGWNFITNNGDPDPIPGNPVGYHGTHCAGISNGSTDNGIGIASISWNLSCMAICVDESNSLPYAWDGIIYAGENGADIISCSWGGSPFAIADQEVVNYVTGLGCIVLAAAGNANGSALYYPADYPGVISVASVSTDDTKAFYSSYNLAVDLAVPGGDDENAILSTIPGDEYEISYGTSMATPLAAGCLGLLKSYYPDWTNEQLITQLLGSTDNIDTINPGYENMLGTGRVNAFRLLSEENVTMPLALKLAILSLALEDDNGNMINEPGEIVTLNIEFQNFSPFQGDDQATLTLTTEDPDIIILTGTGTVDIPPDGIFTLEVPYQIQVGAEASSHFAVLTIHVESDIPVIVGQEMDIQVLVAPSGILVYEGVQNGQDYSGAFIADYLDQLGHVYTYSNTFISLLGFETVFLSFGNYESASTSLDNKMASAITDYLDLGGYVYLEGGEALGWDQAANEHLLDLFGIDASEDGSYNPINSLAGQPDAITNGMLFTSSNQSANAYIDKYTPSADAFSAFVESNYGIVGVQHSIPDACRTFCFSYSLANLNDGETPSTREEILNRLLDFFDISTGVKDLAGLNSVSCNVYPNPMHTNAFFRYYIPENAHVILEVYNSTGAGIIKLVDGNQLSGDYHVQWNASGIPAGIYFYSLSSGKQVQTGKLVIAE